MNAQSSPIFGQGMFTLDPNMTPDQVAKKRAMIAQLVGQPRARYVGEGVGQLASGILAGVQGRKLDKIEGAGQAAATDIFGRLLERQATSASTSDGYGGDAGGTWTPSATPKPTDVLGGMDGGLTFGLPSMPEEGAGGLGFGSAAMTPQEMIIAGAKQRGLDPIDVATAISYETGGTFDPMQPGPTTQWGHHRGLIQFGEPQANQYGADFSDPNTAMRSQLDPASGAVWNYLDQTGVKPGMGLDNIYSAINAGAPGRFGASDANNGGAPGTVAQKVAGMGDHREKAAQFMGGTWTPNADAGGGSGVTVSTQGAPSGGAMPGMSELYGALANPWLNAQQRAVITSMIQQQTEAADPMRQIQLQTAQLQLAQMQQPQAPKPIEVGGVLLDPNTFQPIFDSRTPDATKDPAAVQEYQFYANQEQAAGRQPLSFNDWDLQGKKAGATTVNNTVGGAPGDDALRKKLMEGEGVTWSNYLTAGTTSAGMTQDMELLKQVIEMAPQGPVTGRLAQMFPGVSDAAGVFQSVVKRVAPSLRVEGSGSQSDIEYNGFLQSLPALSNRPEANRAIATFLEAKAKINMERAAAIREYQDGTVDAPTARAKIAEIDRRSILSPQLKGLLGAMDGGSTADDDAAYLKSLGLE